MMVKPLLFCFVLTIAACGGTQIEGTPEDCMPEVQVFLIDVSAFPEGWSSTSFHRPADAHGASGRCGMNYFFENGNAFEEVYQYSREDEAVREYQRQSDVFFPVNRFATPWEVPEPFIGYSSTADTSFLACSNQGGVEMCSFLGRYGALIVRFNTHMAPEFMTFDELEFILRAIDSKMR